MKTTIREMQDPFALRFNDNAISRMEINSVANVNMVTGISEYEKSAKTCYGVLSANRETNILQNNDGTACPAPSVFVTIKIAGGRATTDFLGLLGHCSRNKLLAKFSYIGD